MIKVNNLSKKYNSIPVLQDISFTIQKGELTVIYGQNGAGKTTLIKALVGLIPVNNGTIEIVPNNKSEINIYLGQEMLIDKLKVKEYLFLSGILKGISENDLETRIIELSNRMQFDKYLDYFISTISLGTKTKVLFAASLLNNPKVLIMDEPFLGLDLITLDDISQLLLELKESGCTIFISSHQVDVLENIVDRILILKNSQIIIDDTILNLNIQNSSQLSDFVIKKLK